MVSVKRTLHNSTALTSAGLALLLMASAASANPQDGQVVAGDATITTPEPSTLVVNQHSQNVVLEWGSFDIDAGETTTFVQPDIDAWALNRVVGSQNPSVIAGTLNSNGNIAIVNPDGIVFSHGSRVDVGGLVASTADIGNDAFMRGELSFNLPGNLAASVINEGTVSVRDHGLAAFVAPGVRNSGVITARFGTVSLASGNTFALDLYGDGLVSLAIGDEITEEVIDVATGEVMADLVANEGTISANGGTVALTAATARTAVNSVINNTGVIEANSVGMRDGKIILGAQTATSRPAAAPPQTVRVSGQIRATAVTTSLRPAMRPGTIEITGEDIQIAGATIDTSGTNGGGTILIGGDYLGGQEISDLFPVGEEVREDYEIATAATVMVDSATTINASATDNGDGDADGGKIILWSDVATITSGKILAFGSGDGTGGFIETSSAGTLHLPDGYVSAGQGGMWLLDPETLYVTNRDAVSGDTEFVSASTVESALNAGTNMTLVSTGDDAQTIVNSQISKTAGGDATLSLGSTGSVRINANITSTSGELTVAVRASDTLEPFVNGSLSGSRDGELTISDATIETNGGGFVYRGAAFQMTNSVVSFGGPSSDVRPGNIRTNGGAMLFELSALPAGSSDASGFIGCNGFYAVSCGQSSQVLDAGDGAIVFRQNPNATTTNSDNFPKIFVGDYGIATTGTLTLDGVNLRSERRTNRNSVYNVEFGTLSLLNGAIIDFPFQDALGLEAFYTPVAVSGVSLPTGTYRVGERIIIQLPTLFTSPNSPILSLDVSGPSGGSYEIVGNELVIDFNGTAGPINLTFRATTFAGTSTDLVLSLNIQEREITEPLDNPPTVIVGSATLPDAELNSDDGYSTTTPVLFADDNGVGGLTLVVSGLPSGFSWDDNGNGTVTITGNPSIAGAVSFTVTATDAGGNSINTSGSFTVNEVRVIAIKPQDDPGTFVSLGFGSEQREEFENSNFGMSRVCRQTGTCWGERNSALRSFSSVDQNSQSLPVQAVGGLSHQETLDSLHEINDLFGGGVSAVQLYSAIDELIELPATKNAFVRAFGPVNSTDELLRYFSTPWGKHYLKEFKATAAGKVRGFIPTIADLLGGLAMAKVESDGHTDDATWAASRITINSAVIAIKFSSKNPIDKADAFKDAAIWASEDSARTTLLLVEGASQADSMHLEVRRMNNYIVRTAEFVSQNRAGLSENDLEAYASAIHETTRTMLDLAAEIDSNPGLVIAEFFRDRIWRPWNS
ncbi:filamentous hemagglutinin N-terminal domain-containing protein [Marinovum sp. 2_MG-2023]|uniref:two-partner secretion domain-containing protein n=1 Tax=unclassified Marinovum TaxID=2647166 RepID=UPI0026E2C9B1|nr:MULTISPECIES: filamentous hemagglutinin N-terminal domain-containing protein [unclassified Marinovum]MDO6732834.1 filamentous hemagglutinin N-terminal domain-containing protein [Marinovum sp. 2_MG-2023]MDO6782124.1 filamentous hemagglutinin N-terminal domain-containing protein [Marinovum sp. 1_MG-2023]